MFNNASYRYDKNANTYTFNGLLGYRFKYVIDKLGYSIPKQKYLFVNIGVTGFTVNRFFLPDVYFICKKLLAKGSVFGVNLKVVTRIVDIIDNEILPVNTNITSLDLSTLKGVFKHKPLEAQLPAYEAYPRIRSINGNRGMLLDGAIGLGKTYIALTIAYMLDSDITLIIAPLSTINKVWVNSIDGEDSIYVTPPNSYVIGSKEPYKGERFVISQYENIDKIIPLKKEHNINFETIIVDEVHNFNNIKASRTKLLMDVVTDIEFKHAVPMSGTPVKARPSDLLPLFRIINTDFDKKTMSNFIKLYKGRSGLMLEVLKERYKDYTIAIRKSTMDIPPLTTLITKVKLSNAKYYTLESISKRVRSYVVKREAELLTKKDDYTATYLRLYNRSKVLLLETRIVTPALVKLYEDNVKVIINSYDHGNLNAIPKQIKEANHFEKTHIFPLLNKEELVAFKEAKTIHKYLMLKVQGEALANIIMRARIECYTDIANSGKEIIKCIDSTVAKTIIFSSYIETCEAAVNICKGDGYNPIEVFGNNSKHLTRNVSVFANDKKVNPLVATYKSLSTGVPLTTANVIVILGLPFRQYILDQAVGRCWRTGQPLPVTMYVMELDTKDEPNITNRDLDIISFFRDEVARLTGNKESVVIEKTPSIINELGLYGMVEPSENYMSKRLKIIHDKIKEWT